MSSALDVHAGGLKSRPQRIFAGLVANGWVFSFVWRSKPGLMVPGLRSVPWEIHCGPIRPI